MLIEELTIKELLESYISDELDTAIHLLINKLNKINADKGMHYRLTSVD